MDFQLSDELVQLRDAARSFARAELPGIAARLDVAPREGV